LNLSFLDHRGQRLLGHPPRLEEAREVISQSGETSRHGGFLALCEGQWLDDDRRVVNVPTSSIARAAAPTLAGPEIGVASTKAFTCQLAAAGPRSRSALPRRERRLLLLIDHSAKRGRQRGGGRGRACLGHA
jgi:hypothetical protein